MIVHSKVINLTSILAQEHGACASLSFSWHLLHQAGAAGTLADPILDAAGTDVSHWFDASTNDVRHCIDEDSELKVPYTPNGRFIHVAPRDPTTTWERDFETPWWQDASLVVGKVTAKVRKARVVNTLTHQEHVIEMGCEETMSEAASRFLAINAHAGIYTWKALLDGEFRPMDMGCTLAENGVPDQDEEMEALHMDPDAFLPTLHIYYNDDLTSG